MKKFDAFEIRSALGDLADGYPVPEELQTALPAAVRGEYETADCGHQIFVVGIPQADLHNIDTEELIWPRSPDTDLHPDNLPLQTMLDADAWLAARRYWLEREPVAWSAFVWRIAVPISKRLHLVDAWRNFELDDDSTD